MTVLVERQVFEDVQKIFGRKQLKIALDATFLKLMSDMERLLIKSANSNRAEQVQAIKGLRETLKMFGATAMTAELLKVENTLKKEKVSFSSEDAFQMFFVLLATQKELSRLNRLE